ncbi:MAG TPA: MOSC domain-containing protein [Rhizobiaceae bacterium]|nr:MOSC domain-containing protein [Rhizobiaceae bacterium]
MEIIADLIARFPREGRVAFIGVRPERRAPVARLESVFIGKGGLVGDHRDKPGARAVTLIQAEHLAAIAALAGLESVDPADLRRNIAVSGISLAALRGRRFRIGSAVLKGVEVCAPCSRMEEVLGRGGYNAMRGHGGITAMVIEEGKVRLGDGVSALASGDAQETFDHVDPA